MRKTGKRIIGLLLAVLFVAAIQVPAFARVVDEEITPCWVVSCSSGGKHQMSPRAKGHLYSGTYKSPGIDYGEGYLNQCTLCREVLWSTYHPASTKKIGNYYISDTLKDIVPYYGTDLYMNNTGSVDYFGGSVLTDSYWQGYQFLIN